MFLKELKSSDKAPAAFKDRAKIEVGMADDIPFSKLIIQKSHVTDRKIYICQVNTKTQLNPNLLIPILQAKLKSAAPIDDCEASKECDESEVILRVKDPLAALWPFVGIVAEVSYHSKLSSVSLSENLHQWIGQVWSMTPKLVILF